MAQIITITRQTKRASDTLLKSISKSLNFDWSAVNL
jgi:hypothetical protein